MKPSQTLDRHRAEIRRIAADHKAANPRVFGSVARGEDTETSDIDILVDAREGATLLDLGGLLEDLKALLGAPIHLVAEGELPQGVRDRILREAKSI